MNVNSYLTELASVGIVRNLEKVNINKSLEALRQRIIQHFGTGGESDIKEHFVFGSYTRDTILPRSMDSQSDVDYMIVFANSEVQPQAYLDRLRRFAEQCYESKEIVQSRPTIVLSLDHIRFELVPAIDTSWSGLRIPGKRSGFSRWMDTAPNSFNKRLTAKNMANQDLIKPLVRLLKYWNVCNDYPFGSFELENGVVDHWPLLISVFGGTLWERLASFIKWKLDADFAETEHQKKAIVRAQRIVEQAEALKSDDRNDAAVRKIQRLLPPIAKEK